MSDAHKIVVAIDNLTAMIRSHAWVTMIMLGTIAGIIASK